MSGKDDEQSGQREETAGVTKSRTVGISHGESTSISTERGTTETVTYGETWAGSTDKFFSLWQGTAGEGAALPIPESYRALLLSELHRLTGEAAEGVSITGVSVGGGTMSCTVRIPIHKLSGEIRNILRQGEE